MSKKKNAMLAAATSALKATVETKKASKVETKKTTVETKASKQEKEIAMTTVFAPNPETGNRYRKIMDDKAMAAYTASAMLVAGYLHISKAGLVTRGKRKANSFALRSIIGPSAFGYWTRNRWIDDKGATASGRKKTQSRLNGEDKVKTSLETVKKFTIAMMGMGEKKVDLGDNRIIKFESPIRFMAR